MLTAGITTRAVELNVYFLHHKPSPKAFQWIRQYIQPYNCRPRVATPDPHPASSPPRWSETSQPDSCSDNRFASPKNFCTNCRKLSQGSSSGCSSLWSWSRPDCSSATWLQFSVLTDLSGQTLIFDNIWHFGEVWIQVFTVQSRWHTACTASCGWVVCWCQRCGWNGPRWRWGYGRTAVCHAQCTQVHFTDGIQRYCEHVFWNAEF